MRAPTARREDRAMSSPTPVRRLTIELDATTPVRGRVLVEVGISTAFAGWLDLMAVLQALCGTVPADFVERPR